ncbi:hypothetical protein [Thermococcus sp.]|uniref:hypothetical protein n=1 Tax=Thermococcus sp. TaxID=35749 RepID=UPI002633CFF1|nr:hypothetical protein [Thermococcus sp.]
MKSPDHEQASSITVSIIKKTTPAFIPRPNRLKRWSTTVRVEIPRAGATESLRASGESGRVRFTKGKPRSQTMITAQQGQRKRDSTIRESTNREPRTNDLRDVLFNTLNVSMTWD